MRWALNCLLKVKQRRPRQPQKREKETWQEFLKRDRDWRKEWASAYPTGFGPDADLEGMRERLTGKAITSPGDVFFTGMNQPYDDRPSIRCNAAGVAWLQRGQVPDPTGPRTCPYWDDAPCTHPDPDPTREAGTVTGNKSIPTLQLHLFDPPQWELIYNPCCVEGVYRLSNKLKKMGYTVKTTLGQSDDVKLEYEILFGMKPCYATK